MNDENSDVIAPPPALIANNPLKWLRYFGPGAIIASATIGSGETLFATRGGSLFGYNILWIFVYVSLLKWVLCYCSMRHMILSGAHPYQRWNFIPGPRGWFPIFMFSIPLLLWPVWYGFLSGVMGTAFMWVFGVQAIFAGNDIYIWATLFLTVGVIILFIGNYTFVEIGQIVIIGLMTLCMVIAIFYLGADWMAVIKGTIIPHAVSFPEWLYEVKPDMINRSAWVEILVYTGVIGGASFDYLGYVSFLRDKKWGRSHMEIATNEELKVIAQDKDHPVRRWIRAALIDTVCSFAMIIFLSGCFSILGTIVLSPQHQFPSDVNLLNLQGQFFTALAPWLLPVYKVAIFFAFLSIIYGGPELTARVFFEYFNSLPRFSGRVPKRKIRIFIIFWCLIGGIILLWSSKIFPDISLVEYISPASIISGVLSCGLYCFFNPWMDWKFLPPELRMNRILVGLNLFAGVIFLATGMKALWDHWEYNILILAGHIVICMVLAKILFYRFFSRKSDR